ncbi:MAG: 4-methylaminobutanoate oxidase (formaldehyde-forming) [Alphaproteobacteria bacterium MarineAlpha5_Bin10]|nr:MAG: 4-methylaminobutanoate oxidase (formaldehyde-forming) [Alphaproteobacteria bacterium MarineAlpha5_Bin10]|tara:strand:- start:2521 stop:4938 length:2418 start_codon:yes stop_codon:yes gene_type:complete
MENNAKVVIIGGGVVGCSILFHLSKFGLKDCILLERNELTSGSSWHAAGNVHVISSDPNISKLMAYTINLYKEIEETSGHSVGMKQNGGFYLASNNTWYDYLKRERSKARYMGLDQEFISLKEVAKKNPLIDPQHYIAALWDPIDAEVDPTGVTYAYAKSAKVYGGKYYTHTPVLETNQRNDGTWDVITEKGNVHTEILINAAGLWAREVAKLAGINFPIQPMEHHYLITESIPEIESLEKNKRLPIGTDFDGNIYFRQEGNGMLLGTYEAISTPWQIRGTPMNFGHELLDPKLENIQDRLAIGFKRIPALEKVGIKNIINGPFTFGPDGNPLIGPVPGKKNYWAAVAIMAGFCQAGGVGKCIAEWIIDGEPSIDVWAMDVARFGNYATPEYGTIKSSENYERRFIMTFPNETLPKGRKQKTTSIYDRLISKGAVMGDNFGLENVMWFAKNTEDAYEEPTFRRSRSHAYVADEVNAVRNAVGFTEIANFAKHEITGEDSRKFLNYILAGKIPLPGSISLSPMLSKKGKLIGDLTVACMNEENFILYGSGVAQEMHRRWFENFIMEYDVVYKNKSDDYHGIAISGPNSRKLLSRISREDVSNNSFQFKKTKETFIAGVPAILNRLSFSGELGYEIYVAPHFLLKLFETIEANGEDLGLKLYGSRALMSLRLEKNWGAWTLEYRPDFTAHESGLDKFIDWNKDFIGKKEAIKEKDNGPNKKLVTMVVSTKDIDVISDEAIIKNNNCVGYVTSGGYAHYIKKSIAFGYVSIECAKDGTNLEIEINGKNYSAYVTNKILYDPLGGKMRS